MNGRSSSVSASLVCLQAGRVALVLKDTPHLQANSIYKIPDGNLSSVLGKIDSKTNSYTIECFSDSNDKTF